MARIAYSEIENIIKHIGELANIPTSREEALNKGGRTFLFLEYASAYGGYRLVNVGVANGAHYGAFNGTGTEARRPAKEMIAYLNGILAGLQYAMRGNNL